MTFARLTLSAALLSALALPAVAQGTAPTHPLVPAAKPTTAVQTATPAKPEATTVTKPETTMASPAQTKPATVKPN